MDRKLKFEYIIDINGLKSGFAPDDISNINQNNYYNEIEKDINQYINGINDHIHIYNLIEKYNSDYDNITDKERLLLIYICISLKLKIKNYK